jgi:hypothetical protein
MDGPSALKKWRALARRTPSKDTLPALEEQAVAFQKVAIRNSLSIPYVPAGPQKLTSKTLLVLKSIPKSRGLGLSAR